MSAQRPTDDKRRRQQPTDAELSSRTSEEKGETPTARATVSGKRPKSAMAKAVTLEPAEQWLTNAAENALSSPSTFDSSHELTRLSSTNASCDARVCQSAPTADRAATSDAQTSDRRRRQTRSSSTRRRARAWRAASPSKTGAGRRNARAGRGGSRGASGRAA